MIDFAPLAAELETPRLLLRRLEPADAAAVRKLWSERDPRAVNTIGADGRPSVEDLLARLESQRAESDRNGIHLLAVERKTEGDFVGYCGLIVGKSSLQEPEIAYEFLARSHNRGYATEAARQVLHAAGETGRTRLWATVRRWNTPSFRVLQKLGFSDSGRVDADPVRGDSLWWSGRCGSDASEGPVAATLA